MRACPPNRSGTFSVILLRLCCTTQLVISEQFRRFSDINAPAAHSLDVNNMVRSNEYEYALTADFTRFIVFISFP